MLLGDALIRRSGGQALDWRHDFNQPGRWTRAERIPRPKGLVMMDVLFVVITLTFFALAAAYAQFCGKIR